MLFEVRVLDKNGQLKKTIKPKELLSLHKEHDKKNKHHFRDHRDENGYHVRDKGLPGWSKGLTDNHKDCYKLFIKTKSPEKGSEKFDVK